MHSKWQLWDFFQSYPKGSWSSLTGRVALQAFDPLALRLMKDHLLAGVTERPKQVVGNEVQASWIEDQFLSLGLFGNTESWIINTPDEAPIAARDILLRDDLLLEGRALALAFHSDTAYLKKFLKLENVTHIQLEAPRFWETAKLVDFLCTFFRLPLGHDSKNYLVEAIENEFMPLFDACRLIKLNHPEKNSITLKEVQDLIGVDRLDQFALARDMGKKAWEPFFKRLLSIEEDFDRYRGLFSFLQGHLLKLADVSYLKDKARLTKYDQEIQTLARGWNQIEVRDLLQQLQTWEIASKSKDSFLLTELRQAHLQSHRNGWKPSTLSKI